MASPSLLILAEVLGEDPFRADVSLLSPTELLAARNAMRQWFARWTPLPTEADRFRVAFWTEGTSARAHVADVGRMGLIAHEIVLRDPLDEWAQSPTADLDLRVYGEELKEALSELKSFLPCVRAGLLLFAPLPKVVSEHIFDATTIQALDREEQARDLTADPGFAGVVLGRVPVADDDWRLVVFEDEDPTERNVKDLSRFDDQAFEVWHQASAQLKQTEFAQACQADLVARGKLDDAFVAASLRASSEQGTRSLDIQAWDVLRQIQLPDFTGIKLADLAAIRDGSDAFNEWRLWLGHLCSEAESLARGTDTELCDQFGRSLELAKLGIDTSVKGELRKYAQDRQAYADLLALALGLGASVGTGSPVPGVAAGGNALFSVMRRTVLRRRTPGGWQGVLMRLGKTAKNESSR